MKILLAPSETKSRGGDGDFDLKNLSFQKLYNDREYICKQYTKNIEDAKKAKDIFKLKREQDIEHYQRVALNSKSKKAVRRYTGVAFDHLEYDSLDKSAQEYIDGSVTIFSNLFGPIKAGDQIPEYRLAQGARIGNIDLDKYYAPIIKEMLDREFRDEDILDIRAGYYDRFYMPSKSYTTLKFLKNGKVISHWAKAYRGLILREIAKAGTKTIDEFMRLPIKGLQLKEIQTKKGKTEIIYEIR